MHNCLGTLTLVALFIGYWVLLLWPQKPINDDFDDRETLM